MLRHCYAAALLGLLLGLSTTACKKDAPAPVSPPAEKAPAASAQGSERPVLDGAAALSVLPKDAIAVALADGLEPMFERIGRDRLAKEFAVRYRSVTARMVAISGKDLLDPASYPAIGVDAKKPFGFAMLSLNPATAALVVPLSDPAAFTAFIDALPKKLVGELAQEKKGAATILRSGGGRFAIVLRDGVAVIVTGDRGAIDSVDALATLEPAGSLAANEAMKKTVAALNLGAQGAAWVDLGALSKVAIAEEERSIEKLDVEGDDPEWHERRKVRRAAELELMRTVLGAFDGLAVGGGIDGGTVRTKAVIDLVDDARLGKLLRNGKGSPAIVGAMTEQPMLLVAGHTDPTVAWEMAALMVRTEGEDLDSIAGELRELTGVDVKAEALPLLTGEAGVAVTGNFDAMREDPEESRKSIGATLAFGVTDAAKAKALLEKVTAVPDFAALLERDGDLWKMEMPVWRTIWFGVVGTQLAFGTDKAVLDRLGKGETAGSFVSKAGAPLAGLLSGEGPALVYLQDFTPVFWLLFASRDAAFAEPAVPEGASAEWLEKKAALDAARRMARITSNAAEARQSEMVFGMFDPIGTTAFVVRVQEPGFVVEGGQFTKAQSIQDLLVQVGSVYRSSRAGVEASREAASKARNETWRLEDELRSLGTAPAPAPPEPPIEPKLD